jgi:RNA polymerase sigma-70 factor (ECF subfamily)
MAMTDDARDAQAALAARTDGSGAQESHRAFGRIYDRHSAVVRALCVRHLPSEAEADDALQETFLRAYRLLHELSDAGGMRSWLYAIARNVCAERRRSAARRSKHEHAAVRERIVMSGLTSTNHSVDARRREPAGGESAERSEALSRLSSALDELPDDERLAIHLYYLEPDPVVAAGNSLGISRSGFYKLLARAREHLGLKLGSVAP